MTTTFPADKILSPVQMVVLQGTSFCNLNCSYCDLSATSRRMKDIMSMELIERLFSELFQSERLAPNVIVVWHSGEPLTLPPAYYEEAITRILALKAAWAGDRVEVTFDIQTNGVLIDAKWCDLFKKYQAVLNVGISCDGPAHFHDAYRRNWSGRESHAQTVRGMDLLSTAGIRYNVIAVVTRDTLNQAEAFYHFFYDRREQLSGFHFNILAEAHSDLAALSYTDHDRSLYYQFYRRLLKLSQEFDSSGSEFKIRNFSLTLARIIASRRDPPPRYVEEASAPLTSLNVDSKGFVTTFYAGLSKDVLPDLYGDGHGLSLGNIFDTSFEDMARSVKLQEMIKDFDTSTRACADSCPYFGVCTGGFEITKKVSTGTFDTGRTIECAIHVQTLVDAVLDDIADYLSEQEVNTQCSPAEGTGMVMQ